MKLFYGTIVHSASKSQLSILYDAAVAVDKGEILFVKEGADLDKLRTEYELAIEDIVRLKKTEFLMPGFVDTHIHASQYPNAGLALDLPLLAWLSKYTFTVESRFSDLNFARDVYTAVVANTLCNGTTTAMYFATIHKEASLLLADIAYSLGQRAFIGKVSMDQNGTDYYQEDTKTAIADAEDFAKCLIDKMYPLVQPVITPRFAISCTMELMKGLAEIANKYKLNIQTHLSENQAECALALELFPNCENYVEIYKKANLLTKKTILAHAVHLSDEEIGMLASHGSSVSHCPNSNTSIRSGLCDVRKLSDKGVEVGLGTDISAGYHPSIHDAMRHTITVSNILSLMKPGYQSMNYQEAFYLGTLGGARALGLDGKIGTLEAGKNFDALIIDLVQGEGNLDLWPGETIEERISKWIFLGDDRSIKSVYIQGKEVKTKAKKILRDRRNQQTA